MKKIQALFKNTYNMPKLRPYTYIVRQQKEMVQMAKVTVENGFIKQATRIGLETMLADVNCLLLMELTEGQKITNEEIKAQILKYLDELK
jgi:ribosomal protein S8